MFPTARAEAVVEGGVAVDGLAVAQSVPDGGFVPVVGTFVLAALFYAVTLHLAATFFVGDVPASSALAVGTAVAVATLATRPLGAVVAFPATLLVDAGGIRLVYGRGRRATAVLVLLHFAFSVVLGIALLNLASAL